MTPNTSFYSFCGNKEIKENKVHMPTPLCQLQQNKRLTYNDNEI